MSVARRLLFVVGMKREAALIPGSGAAICSGGDVGLLERRLAAVDPGGLDGVVSFGLAGGLDPALAPGDLVLATSVVAPPHSFSLDPDLSNALASAIGTAGLAPSGGGFAGVGAVVLTPRAKAALRSTTGAVAVDMESHVAARFAAAHGLPFAALRAVSDPADRALPAIAAQALTPEGDVDYVRVIAGLARAPREIGSLLKAGRDSAAAFAALERAGRALAAL